MKYPSNQGANNGNPNTVECSITAESLIRAHFEKLLDKRRGQTGAGAYVTGEMVLDPFKATYEWRCESTLQADGSLSDLYRLGRDHQKDAKGKIKLLVINDDVIYSLSKPNAKLEVEAFQAS